MVSLLELFSQSLLKMSGPAIRQWFADVADNRSDWFKTIAVELTPNPSNKAESSESPVVRNGLVEVVSWASFTRGWIHATAGDMYFAMFLTITHTLPMQSS